ncbi:MAG: hypothetical protein PQJ49_10465 [Sphaerochaetaceae bacterium]|nr:hypothetical protein [Sphaerochaetaceae bacterium]
MNSFEGYILESELYKKAKVSASLFKEIKGVEIKKMGNTSIVKKDTLPTKYKAAASKCQDLDKHLTMAFFNELLGCSRNYLLVYEHYKKIKFTGLKIGGYRLIEISEEFKTLWNKGKVPFLIKPDNEEYADEIIQMQGLEIGFY